MKLWLPFGMTTVLMIWASTVFAYPNLNATTGLIGVPNSHIVAPGEITGAVDAVFFDDSFLNVRGVFGLTPQLEGGVAAILGDNSGVALNAKYQFGAKPAGFTWAFGATVIAADEPGDGWQAYIVGTQPLALGGTAGSQLYGTVGLNFTSLDHASAVRPFLGAQWLLAPRYEIGGELMFGSGDLDESISSLYLRHTFNPQLSGQIGFTNANGFIGRHDHDLFLGVAYTFKSGGGER